VSFGAKNNSNSFINCVLESHVCFSADIQKMTVARDSKFFPSTALSSSSLITTSVSASLKKKWQRFAQQNHCTNPADMKGPKVSVVRDFKSPSTASVFIKHDHHK